MMNCRRRRIRRVMWVMIAITVIAIVADVGVRDRRKRALTQHLIESSNYAIKVEPIGPDWLIENAPDWMVEHLNRPVELRARRVEPQQARAIGQLTSVRYMRIYPDAGAVAELSSLRRLESLHLYGRQRIGAEPHSYLPWFYTLEPAAADTKLTSADVKVIIDLPKLHTLTVSGIAIPRESMPLLARMKRLERLEVDGFASDDLVKHLIDLPKLSVLKLAGWAVTDEALMCLSSMPSLRMLELRATRMSDAGVEALANVRTLIFVRIVRSNNSPNFTHEGVARLRQLRPALAVDASTWTGPPPISRPITTIESQATVLPETR